MPPSLPAALSPAAVTSPTVPVTIPVVVPTSTAPEPGEIPPPAVSLPHLCSPLQDVPLSQLAGLVSNPYHPPPPGSDDPHAGVDLAMRLPGSHVAVAGQPVQAALGGQVILRTQDRFPFGNAVIIETPLNAAPEDGWFGAQLPTPAPTPLTHSALTCPAVPDSLGFDPANRSLYTLYAHFKEPSPLAQGQAVTCGQVIGTVGDSGNALNPHLHFEMRVGPAGLRLDSMAHYDASATIPEMSSYCLWSVSGWFQLVDPLRVLSLAPSQ